LRVAISHDYLTQRGGAERVVLSLSDAFPGAPIFTSFFQPDGTFDEFQKRDVRPSVVNHLGPLRQHFRTVLPAYPAIFRAHPIDADVTICSSSGWSHGSNVSGRKVVYCHAPARWLYQKDNYLQSFPGYVRPALAAMRRPLLSWDRRAAASADRYLANSRHTRDMIWAAYGIDAEVLPPPHSVDPLGLQRPIEHLDPGFFLSVSRLLAYKNIREIIEAFRGLPQQQLVIAGDGPLDAELRATCPRNVRLIGRCDDEELRWLYANARALVAASYEDLGLTPIEAALFGTPTLALRHGGYLDTIVEQTNGLFIERPSPAAIRTAVRAFTPDDFDDDAVRQTAKRYEQVLFRDRLEEIVDEELGAQHR